MEHCCRSTAVPDVNMSRGRSGLLPNTSDHAAIKVSSRRFHQSQPSQDRDVRGLLSNYGDRQEQLFRQVLQQQKQLEDKLLLMQSTTQATVDAQKAFFSEFRDFAANCQGCRAPQDTTDHKASGGAQVQFAEEVLDAGKGSPSALQKEAESAFNSQNDRAVVKAVPNAFAKSQSDYFAQLDSMMSAVPPVKPQVRQSEVSIYQRSSNELQFSHWKRQGTSSEVSSFCSGVNYILKCKEFEIVIALAILSNALVMCLECQYQGLDVGYNLGFPGRALQAHVIWAGAETTFNVFDWFFGLLFAVELILKLLCWRLKYFYKTIPIRRRGESKHCCKRTYHYCMYTMHTLQGWNLLDFFCVAAFLFDKMASIGAVNPQMLRLLRLFRLFRLVRLLRFLESLDHLYIMTTAISGLGEVLIWAIILLTMLLMICNLFLVQVLQATYFSGVVAGDLSDKGLENHHEMYKYFGTCTRCMLSMFEITLGNWPPVARLLSEEVSEWFTFFCIVHKLTIGFAVIGVITGVILQETFKVAQTDDIIMFRQKRRASRVLRQKMRVLFQTLNTEQDGRVTISEFMNVAQDPEIKLWLASLDIETDDLRTLFSLIDLDRSGSIDVDELIARMPRIKGYARSVDMLALLQEFRAKP